MRRILALVLLLLTACTPAQIAAVKRQYALTHPAVQIGTAAAVVSDPVHDFWVLAKVLHDTPFLACTRAHESDTAGGYLAFNPQGPYMGAYQYLQGTWNWAAAHYGAPQYAGVDPRNVPGFWQDDVTLNYYLVVGNGPWAHRC